VARKVRKYVTKNEKIDGVNIRKLARVTGLSQTRDWMAWNKEPVSVFLRV